MNQQEKNRKKVSVILPTFNEKENIVSLIQTILQNIGGESEIIVVDDDSPDGTWKEVEELAKNKKNITLLRRMDKKGLVSALNDGMALSSGEIVVWMDCDFSMPPEEIGNLLACIDQGYDVAVGSRFARGGGVEIVTESQDTLMAYLMSFTLNKFIQTVLGRSFKDYTSGFIAIKRNVLEEIPLKGEYGEYFIDLIYRAIKKEYKVIEIPYLCKARKMGVSKTGTRPSHYFKKGLKYIILTLRLRFTKLKK
ncbi:MAG: polyprenol monophosphomannose synthase [Nitrospirota bacterium]|nr:polyprenol monophosphomannose synthase [Candidatus Aminicenantes bacterium]MDH5202187.1 polyprenol monophosphomannose synthase [Nitrospirota bacterium]MDH5744281.1 polyprenol monophosphomannose synthase [Candidatus Aminicenantes bacterium]